MINTIYLNTEVQQCIINQIKNFIKYISSKNKKEFMQDLKKVYQAINGNIYSNQIRKIIYTTNTVEAVPRQFRKLTKTKGVFPNENSLLKLLCKDN